MRKTSSRESNGSTSALTALKKISTAKAIFISRGDDSGTNKKEIAQWKLAGITPSGTWYK
ncbi:hypothetical protein L1999_27805 [Neobacillus drentensis]|uniref:hypothetical protein n=1 Tax=Neobacillus drentensis TaxID=220684 RepID=UPI001F2B7F7C|nr:hypothetical protein [Neobacillus drentensis]ULT56789.1 hypothetical protein L1999_27805 [Neobacillus drentensis]